MPAATPLPGRPAALVLGSADVLLSRDGCAVCSYTAEAGSRYLSWFALEAHADPVTFSRLSASLGMCPGHTRALIRQPGAARRLTPVYWHLMRAVPGRLEARPPLARCPACQHDQAAASRATDIITDWLAGDEQAGIEGSALSRLCLPHARGIAAAAGPRVSRRLPHASAGRATAGHTSIGELAGGPDHDAEERARLRARLPRADDLPGWTCRICLTGARAELTSLNQAAGLAGAGGAGGSAGDCLCPRHLRDTAGMHPEYTACLLAVQHASQSEELQRLTRPRWRDHRWRGGRAARRLAGRCPACQACDHAMRQELERHRVSLSGRAPGPVGAPGLCTRHVLSLQVAASPAGPAAAAHATARAAALAAELAEAFGKNTWMRRHEPRGPETTAWLRAAVFLDGRVFGGGPPPEAWPDA